MSEWRRRYWRAREYCKQAARNGLTREVGRLLWVLWQTYKRATRDAGGGVLVRLQPSLTWPARLAIVNGNYERPELLAVDAELEQDDVVMELGTGIGFIAAYCAKKIGSDRVHTYEANPDLKEAIQEICAINGVSPHLNFCVLGSDRGTANFYVERNFSSSSVYSRSRKSRRISVPARSAREEMDKVRPTFLILDIEGGEYDLLRQIDLRGIKKSFELHEHIIGGEKACEILELLANSGFVEQGDRMSKRARFFRRMGGKNENQGIYPLVSGGITE